MRRHLADPSAGRLRVDLGPYGTRLHLSTSTGRYASLVLDDRALSGPDAQEAICYSLGRLEALLGVTA